MNLRRFAGLALTTSPLAASAYGATVLARHPPSRVSGDFAQPLVVATAWGHYGMAAFAWLAAGVAASAILLAFAVARVARRPLATDRYAILTGAAFGLSAAAAWPFVFSSDVYAYAAYGALAERGFDPFALAPATLHDAFIDAARQQWHGAFPVDVYGPGMLAISRAAVRAAGGQDVKGALLMLRLSADCAFLGSVVLLDVALGDASARRRSVALAAYALNPVVLWGAAEGHNDSFVALGFAASLALARVGKRRTGALVAGLLPLFKATGAAFALGFAIEVLRQRQAHARATVVAALAGLAIAALFGAPPLLRALGVMRAHASYEPALSAQALLGPGPALSLTAAATIWATHRLVHGDARGYAWLGIAALLGLPNVYPWYTLWIMPCVLASTNGPAAIGLAIATIFTLVRYLPDAAGTLTGRAEHLAAAFAIAPLAIALAEFRPRAGQKKVPAST